MEKYFKGKWQYAAVHILFEKDNKEEMGGRNGLGRSNFGGGFR
jgi:hypothetical protein